MGLLCPMERGNEEPSKTLTIPGLNVQTDVEHSWHVVSKLLISELSRACEMLPPWPKRQSAGLSGVSARAFQHRQQLLGIYNNQY